MSEAHAGMMVTPSVRLVRPLGRGGMGSVWVADHLSLRTQVVVKFIASDLKDSREANERFSREAAAAAQVKSPHVVQTFDHGFTPEGVPYIVMELLEGRDLGAVLEEHGSCEPALVAEIIAQLARALERAHARGIVHRDIKPSNIFLCDAGGGQVFVKLLDFGIAKGVEAAQIDSATKTGTVMGSPFYMSPEQILGSRDVDYRSDLWSVGVVAYEALTGQKPFDAETMGGLAIRIHSEPLPIPSRANPSLPASVDAWFQRACARRATERFDSAVEMAEALVAAVTGSALRSTPTSSLAPRGPLPSGSAEAIGSAATVASGMTSDSDVVRSAGKTKRHRLVALVGLGASLCIGAVAVFVLAPDPEAPEPPPESKDLPARVVETASPETRLLPMEDPTSEPTAAAPAAVGEADAAALPASPEERPVRATPRSAGASARRARGEPATTPPSSRSQGAVPPSVADPPPPPKGHDIF